MQTFPWQNEVDCFETRIQKPGSEIEKQVKDLGKT